MTPESLPVRGRQEELSVIEHRLQEVSAGSRGAVVIEGSAGPGKTKHRRCFDAVGMRPGFRVN
jgi:hypothetical protein